MEEIGDRFQHMTKTFLVWRPPPPNAPILGCRSQPARLGSCWGRASTWGRASQALPTHSEGNGPSDRASLRRQVTGGDCGRWRPARCPRERLPPRRLAAAVRTRDGLSPAGVSGPEPGRRRSRQRARAPAVPKPAPTPAERTQRTAGVTLLLAKPRRLQVPRALRQRAAGSRGRAHLRGARGAGVAASPRAPGGRGPGRQVPAGARGLPEVDARRRAEVRRAAGVCKSLRNLPPAVSRGAARARGGGARSMARGPARLQFRVQLRFVTEEQLFGAGPLSPPSPKCLRLEVHPAGEEADATVTDADGVCVFKCLLNRDTECCRVGKESVLITLGYSSALLKFESHADLSSFSNTLKSCRNEKKESSVFSQRTEEASAVQYFQFYGCISQQQNMMQDFVRTATYHRAILQNHIDFRDKIVLDVGCGSGILSFFAVQAGARRVYAVEASSVAQYAEMLVKNNHLSDKIIVLPGKIEDISLPEAIDVIVSEPMGYMLFNERMLESYLHSKKWLKANGMMFPTFSDIHLAPFSDEQLYMEHYSRANFWHQQCFYGVNLSSLRGAAVDEYFRQPIVDTFDVRILMARTVKYTVNFMDAEEADLHRVEIPFVFQMTQSGLIHGLAFWFDVAFVGSVVTVWLSTAPTEPLTHWYQVRCLLHTPLFAKEGETLSGKVLFVANRRQSYDIHIVALVNQTGFRSGNILDLKNPFFRFA
ncbi:histone-arginine methyltransferase CARM1-like [Leopardus geoffroyi]|uniref:histone-arginine methyltransferase CARM1-like n=2 Tax=Felidae TaxID=9681 RepID=UPI001E264AB8|nr:histone-arginine methyltransferase CARM1-like [Leopardus geoffroyi]